MSDDEKADFEALFLDTRAPLLGYLDRRIPSEDAADLLAEVYVIAWRKRSALPRGEERRLWLFGVARRLVAEYHRSVSARSADAAGPDATGDLDHGHGGDRRGEAVRTALASLNDLDRELITLTTWDRLNTADAARVVGITAGTARVRLHRARARLARDPGLRSVLGDPEPGVRVEVSAAPVVTDPRARSEHFSAPPELPKPTAALSPPPERVSSPTGRSPWAPV